MTKNLFIFIREVFVNRFAHMFHSYEHFVIIPTDEDLALTTPQQQESPQNFDKISFLSDQVMKDFSYRFKALN